MSPCQGHREQTQHGHACVKRGSNPNSGASGGMHEGRHHAVRRRHSERPFPTATAANLQYFWSNTMLTHGHGRLQHARVLSGIAEESRWLGSSGLAWVPGRPASGNERRKVKAKPL
eukprot:352338-Chlamydomonas_euryale.AAC.6